MKKLLVMALLVFGIGSSHAAEPTNPMDGFYVGANAGYSKYKIDGFAETFPPNYAARKRTELNVSESDPLIRLNAGYGHYWQNRLFTGLELGFQKLIGSNDHKITNAAIGHEVDIKYSSRFDVGLLLGYNIFHKDLIYIRLGYGVTDVEISPHDIGSEGGAFHDLYGPIYGIGYSRMMGNNFGLRAEVNYLSIDDSYNNNKNDGEIYDVKIKDSQFQMGVFYNF